MLNAVAAHELQRLGDQKGKDKTRGFYFRAAISLVAISGMATFGFTKASSGNYPGGEALMQLYNMEQANVTRHALRPYVHLDVAACQQGITRFCV